MFDTGPSLFGLLVPLPGEVSHIAPVVLGATDSRFASLAERALPTCRALDLWAGRAGRPADRSGAGSRGTSSANGFEFA